MDEHAKVAARHRADARRDQLVDAHHAEHVVAALRFAAATADRGRRIGERDLADLDVAVERLRELVDLCVDLAARRGVGVAFGAQHEHVARIARLAGGRGDEQDRGDEPS